MKIIGPRTSVRTPEGVEKWAIQKVIPSGTRTPKWGVWKNGTHIGSEVSKRVAIAVIEYWPNDPPSKRHKNN